MPSSVMVKPDIPETLPHLRVDPLQIQQVLRNLISNGGSVKVESEVGKGSVFSVTLPAADEKGISI